MMGVLAHSSCLAVEQNSISLDDTVKDAWGLPALRVTFKNHPDDIKAMQFLAGKQREILETAGARKIWFDPADLEETDLLAPPDGHVPDGRRSEHERGQSLESRARR